MELEKNQHGRTILSLSNDKFNTIDENSGVVVSTQSGHWESTRSLSDLRFFSIKVK